MPCASPFPPMPRRHLALALLAALTAACGSGEAGVNVKRLDADVVFGIKQQTPQQAVQAITAGPVEAAPDEEVRLLTPQAVATFGKPRINTGLFPATGCPAAALNAFPQKPASEQVNDLPEAGLYRWKRGGSEKLTTVNNQEIPYTGFEQRLIHNVAKVSEGDNPTSDYDDKRNIVYRYETVQPVDNGFRETTFQVKTNSGVQRQAVAATGQRVRAGDPEAGLAIKRIFFRDRQGNAEESTFESGLLILPLPVSPGEQFTSVAKGARGDALTYRGTVGSRERVDACGEIIEGFRVTGTLSGGDLSQTWNFVVATQHGAMLIAENLEYSSAAGTHKPSYTIGQLKPNPADGGT